MDLGVCFNCFEMGHKVSYVKETGKFIVHMRDVQKKSMGEFSRD